MAVTRSCATRRWNRGWTGSSTPAYHAGKRTDLPGINVPAGLDSDGLPIRVQLYGNFAREDLLLQLAAQVERWHPEWFGAVPAVHVTFAMGG